MPWPRTYEGRPLWGKTGYTALHGAHLSSVPSGDQSANPASVPGRSGLQRALLSVSSAWKRSGAERLATLLGVSRAAVPSRSSASGHRASSSKYTRGQSWETGSFSRLFGSVETTAWLHIVYKQTLLLYFVIKGQHLVSIQKIEFQIYPDNYTLKLKW